MHIDIQLIHSDAMMYAQGHDLSQGYQEITLAAEQSWLNREWGKYDAEYTCILSPVVILYIKAGKSKRLFIHRAGSTEPPYMALSTDPKQYSKVHSTLACEQQLKLTCYVQISPQLLSFALDVGLAFVLQVWTLS